MALNRRPLYHLVTQRIGQRRITSFICQLKINKENKNHSYRCLKRSQKTVLEYVVDSKAKILLVNLF